jgi:hypothetical protein
MNNFSRPLQICLERFFRFCRTFVELFVCVNDLPSDNKTSGILWKMRKINLRCSKQLPGMNTPWSLDFLAICYQHQNWSTKKDWCLIQQGVTTPSSVHYREVLARWVFGTCKRFCKPILVDSLLYTLLSNFGSPVVNIRGSRLRIRINPRKYSTKFEILSGRAE